MVVQNAVSKPEVFAAFSDDHTEDDVLTMMAKINFAATKVGEHPNILRFLGAVVDNDECMYSRTCGR